MTPQENMASAAPAVGHATADGRRQQLLARMQQDREELAHAAAQLRGPVQRMELLKDLVVLATRALPWLPTAGALVLWMRRGKRPPFSILLGVSVQLLNAWMRRQQPALGSAALPAPSRGAPSRG